MSNHSSFCNESVVISYGIVTTKILTFSTTTNFFQEKS